MQHSDLQSLRLAYEKITGMVNRLYTHLHLLQAPCVRGILEGNIAVDCLPMVTAVAPIEHNGGHRQEDGQNARYDAAYGAHGARVAAGRRGHLLFAQGEPNRIGKYTGTWENKSAN